MNKIITLFFLLLFACLTACSDPAEEKTGVQSDRLRRDSDINGVSEKISTRLDLALQILENDKSEAQRLADSALSAARGVKNKNLEMRALYILGRASNLSHPRELSIVYYDSALALTEAVNDNFNKGEILFRIGLVKYNRGEELAALESFNASLQSSRMSDNFKVMGSSYSMMGTIFRVNGLYDRAIEYTVNSKLNYEKAGFTEGYAWSAYILGRIYFDLKLPQTALEYFQEALEIYLKQASVDGNENGVAICYEQIGLLNLASGKYDEALKYIDKTLKIYTASKSEFGISNSNKNLGMIAYSTGDFELAQNYLNESLRVKTKLGDMLSLPTIYQYIGLCLIGKGRTEEGFRSLHQGLDLAISNKQTRVQLNIYSELTEAYLDINDLKNAISCQKKQIEIQDLTLSGAANIKIEQLQTIYEIDKQNGQIAELEKQNKINSLIIKQHRLSQQIMIAGILIALLFSATIYWFYHKIRQKNSELKETNAAKDKLFAVIAHDLRGPTANLAAFMEHLNDTYNEHSPEELKKILISLFKSAENVSLLLENLLIWAQSQLKKTEFNPCELKLTDLLQTAIKGLLQTADNKQIKINLELNDQIYVLADPGMLQVIVRNLLSNAIKFTPRGGSVIIRSAVTDTKNAVISITDNGIGIENHILSKIFDISGSFHTTGTENEKSTGLGLILVKDFVEKNNGTLAIKSQVDEGTVVSFTLPAIKRS